MRDKIIKTARNIIQNKSDKKIIMLGFKEFDEFFCMIFQYENDKDTLFNIVYTINNNCYTIHEYLLNHDK